MKNPFSAICMFVLALLPSASERAVLFALYYCFLAVFVLLFVPFGVVVEMWNLILSFPDPCNFILSTLQVL